MKRLFMIAMAMLSMTMTFAEEESVNGVDNAKMYDMTVNYGKLAEVLNLTEDQLSAVESIHEQFCSNMMFAAGCSKESRKSVMNNAINEDLRFMRMVLDEKQFRSYARVLNMTLINRGLNF